MNKKILIGFCISFLLVLTLISALDYELNNFNIDHEETSLARIIGNSPEDMIRYLRNKEIDFTHASYSNQLGTPDGLLESVEAKFDNNINYVNWDVRYNYDGDTVFNEEDFLLFENNELILHKEARNNWFITDLYNYLPHKFLFLYDVPEKGLYLPKQNLIIDKYISSGNPIIASTYERSNLLTDVFICNLGKYDTLGETYKESRNDYYEKAAGRLYPVFPNELVGLTLMSYNLYGNPLTKVTIPNKDAFCGYCNGLLQEYGEQMITSSYNIQKYSVAEEGSYYIKSVSHQINEYNIDNYGDYSILKISGGHLNLEDLDIVLPKITKTQEFPQDTIITELTNVEFSNPVDLIIEDLPSWEQVDLIERKCYENQVDAGVFFSHTYTEDNHEVVVSNIYPIEIIDCETGHIRLYKNINYDVVYYPYSPIIITNIETDEKAVPNSLIDVKIHIENTQDAPVNGTLYISKEGEILSKLDIQTTKSLYELKLNTPKEEGIYEYKAEFYYENDSRTYTTFDLDVSTLEIDLMAPDVIKTNTGIIVLNIENRFEDNINAEIDYYLMKNDNIVYSNTKTINLVNGGNTIDLSLENLKRTDENYDLIMNIYYLNTDKTLTGKIYTNHKPVVIEQIIEFNEGETLEFEPQVFDVDGDEINIDITSEFDLNGSYDFNYEDSGEYIIEVRANDGYSESIGEIELRVNNFNRPPILQEIEKITAYEGELITLNPVYSDPDNENSVENDDNILTISYSDKFIDGEWTPNYEDSGTHWIEVVVSDGELTNTRIVEIEVLNKNRPPELDSLGNIHVSEGELINLDSFSAIDPDNENNVTNDDNELTFTIDSNKFVDNSWQTNYEDSGEYSIEVSVSDGEFTDTQTILLIIDNTNRPPELQAINDITVNETELVKIEPVYSDPDNENNVSNDDNELTISYSEKIINNEWQTDYFSSGEYVITATVSDGELIDSKEFIVTVNNVNRNPIINNVEKDKEILAEGETLTIDVDAEDPDLENLIYKVYLDGELVDESNESHFEYIPGYTTAGIRELKIVVEDPYQATDEEIMSLEITNTLMPPVVEDIPDINSFEGSTVEIIVNASEYDNLPLTYSINDTRFTQIENKFSWIVDYNASGEYSVEIIVSNEELETIKIVTINIVDVNRVSNIVDYYPKETLYINQTQDVEVRIEIFDPDGVQPLIEWYVNNEKVLENSGTLNFNPNGEAKEFNIKAKITDGKNIYEQNFKIISSDKPIITILDGSTTNFNEVSDLTNIQNLILERRTNGKIEYLVPVNLKDIIDLESHLNILRELIAVNGNIIELNKPARITFYNIDMENPIIYYTERFTIERSEISNVCPDEVCYDIDYSGDVFSFTVSHFTSYYLKDLGDIEIKDVDIDVNSYSKDLEEDDEISVKQGDEITLSVEIENNFAEELKDVKVKYSLSKVNKDTDEIDIDAFDSEKEDFKFSIPYDLEPGKYKLIVEVEAELNNKEYDENLESYLIVEEGKFFPQKITQEEIEKPIIKRQGEEKAKWDGKIVVLVIIFILLVLMIVLVSSMLPVRK